MGQVQLKYRVVIFPKNIINTEYYSNMAPGAKIELIDTNTDKVIGKITDISLAMQKYGLAWSEKYGCYTLSKYYYKSHDLYQTFLQKLDETLKRYNNGEQIVSDDERERERYQSYYTGCLYQSILRLFPTNVDENSIILDPAAGNGDLLKGYQPHQVIAIDSNKSCQQTLISKGYKVIKDTFENVIETGIFPSTEFPQPTHIIMNPPFSKQKDIIFFNNAYQILQEGGSLSAIVSENSIWEELKNYQFIGKSLPLQVIAYIMLRQEKAENLSTHMKRFFEIILETLNDGLICIEGLTEVDTTWGRCSNTSARMFIIRLQKPLLKSKKLKRSNVA